MSGRPAVLSRPVRRLVRKLRVGVLVMAALSWTLVAASTVKPNLTPASPVPASLPSALSDLNVPADSPRISFDATDKDLGQMLYGVPVKTEYRFANLGKEPLRILGMKTSCSRCTAALPEKKELLAGESSLIRVQVNTRSLTGPLSYFINVKTNDPREPELALKLKFEIMPQVTWAPKALNLGKAPPGKMAPGTITIDSRTTAPLTIQLRPWNEALLEARIESVEPASEPSQPETAQEAEDKNEQNELTIQRFVLHCETKPKAPPGDFFDTLILETNNPLFRTISIPVSGSVVGALELETKEVFLGILEPGAKVEKDVKLAVFDPGIKVRQVKTNVPGLTADSLPVEGGCSIHLVYQASEGAGVVEGAVEIETDAPSSPVAVIAVRGMVRARAR